MIGGFQQYYLANPIWNYGDTVVVNATTPPTVVNLNVTEAYKMITSGSALYGFCNIVVDTRDKTQYDTQHIVNSTTAPILSAINIPYLSDSDFATKIGPLAGQNNSAIILYCQNTSICGRSAGACQYLISHGYNKLYNLANPNGGGLDAWIAAGYPTAATPPSTNLLSNPSVENGGTSPEYWTSDKSPDVTGQGIWSSTVAHAGSRSLQLNANPNPSAPSWEAIIWYQSQSSSIFQNGKTYSFRCWYQTSGCQMMLFVSMFRADGSWIKTQQLMNLRSSTPTTWQQPDWMNFTITSDTSRVSVGFGIELGGIDSGVSQAQARADDFEAILKS
jgi:rhodanese-related sulfurtransferase